MGSITLEKLATHDNFNEEDYLRANPDVARAVENHSMASGWDHFKQFGAGEGRMLRGGADTLRKAKAAKLARILPYLRNDMPVKRTELFYDFLSSDLRHEFNIVDTDAVSSNGYDGHVMRLIEKHARGLLLDCGAGKRPVYFENVVNFEIVPYDTTDVRGVGEVLPFIDGCFDAVVSIAVLEHVKDPFRCAKEIVRVLKPGGDLICCVPFLQPLHGYPHHYYNMTHQGLRNLFERTMTVDQISVYESVLPIWSLSWMLRSWAEGLEEAVRAEFLDLRVADLLQSGDKYLTRPFVQGLSHEKNLELASACVLFAHKPPSN